MGKYKKSFFFVFVFVFGLVFRLFLEHLRSKLNQKSSSLMINCFYSLLNQQSFWSVRNLLYLTNSHPMISEFFFMDLSAGIPKYKTKFVFDKILEIVLVCFCFSFFCFSCLGLESFILKNKHFFFFLKKHRLFRLGAGNVHPER